MLRGTRVLIGDEVKEYNDAINKFREVLNCDGFNEIIIPNMWNTETCTDKLGQEKSEKMWGFKDKAGRNCCLIPEVTGIIQELWNNGLNKTHGKLKLFYVQRCYRYDRPQQGRYREFTQIGVEILRNKITNETRLEDKKEIYDALTKSLNCFSITYKLVENVTRGISYYETPGFEVECNNLGAQKQIAGGGTYNEGQGWAVGVERILLSQTITRNDMNKQKL